MSKKAEREFKLKKIKQYSEDVYNQVVNKEITFLDGYNQMMSNVNVTTSFAGKGTRHKDKQEVVTESKPKPKSKRRISKEKQKEYDDNWWLKDTKKGLAHPVIKEVRQSIGRKSTLERMIKNRHDKIQKLQEEIRIYEHERKQVTKEINSMKTNFDLNPIILYNRGRGKQYVQGKIWWYDEKKGFGLKVGKKESKGNKKWHYFSLGRMDECDETFLKDEYGDEWEYEMMNKEDWIQVCKQKFFNKFFPNLL